jgi:hypothetical protein
MSAHPTASPSPKSRMVVRGALALELVPGSQPDRAVLGQADAGALAERIGHDLALLAPQVAALDLVLAGAHHDPAELLRPGWPLHRRLEELQARAPQAGGPRIIAFGADAGGVVPLPLRAEPELLGGPLRVVPFLLVGDAADATAVSTAFEEVLLERGMARAETALAAQDGFAARIEHARYLTAYDLAAMMALQYANVGLDGLWTLLETALLVPQSEAWLDAPPEPLMRYADGAVRVAAFDRDGWQARYASSEIDATRIERGFAHFQARQRQLVAILKVHGLDVEPVPCPAHADARALLG